jgi:hypothetical protein
MNTNFEIAELSMDEMDAIAGGNTISPNTNSTIAVPHVRPRDLLTQQQVAKLLSIDVNFNPPVPHG